MVDGIERNEIEGLFALPANGLRVRRAERGSSAEQDRLQAEVPLDSPEWRGLAHRRTWDSDKAADAMLVTDEPLGPGCRFLMSSLHPAPSRSPAVDEWKSSMWVITADLVPAHVSVLSGAEPTVLRLEADLVSPSRRTLERSCIACLLGEHAQLPCTLQLRLQPLSTIGQTSLGA